MATTQHDGLLTYKDEAGDLKIMYPATRGENVLMESGDTAEEAVSGHVSNQTVHVTASERTAWNGKAPQNHASSQPTYGSASESSYGHVKLANNLTTTSTGSALDARQGKTLNDKMGWAADHLYTIGNETWPAPCFAVADDSSNSLDVVINKIQNENMNNMGGTIFLKHGDYYMNAPVTLKPRVRIVGCGTGVCITRQFYTETETGGVGEPLFILNDECGIENIRFWSGYIPSGATAEYYPLIGTPSPTVAKKGIRLENLELETTYASSGIRKDGLFYGALSGSTIRNCIFPYATVNVNIRSGSDIVIENCDFSYSDVGIYVSDAQRVQILKNKVTNCTSIGIRIAATTDCMIAGNDVSDYQQTLSVNYNGAIGILGYSTVRNTVKNNVCSRSNSVGISAHTGTDNIITGNICTDNQAYGIMCNKNSIITNNYCKDNTLGDIYAGADSVITGNICITSDKEQVSSNHMGIQCNHRTTITGNTVLYGTGLASDILASQKTIYLSTSQNCVVTGNSIMGKDVTDENTDTANKNLKANNKWKGDQA